MASDPANAESQRGLALAYGGLGRSEERAEALRKTQVLARIQNRLGWALSQEGEVAPLLEIVADCREIELWEQARRVAELAVYAAPESAEAKAVLESLPLERS